METNTMGIVLVTALIENYDDVKAAEKGAIPVSEVRRIQVDDVRSRHRGNLTRIMGATT